MVEPLSDPESRRYAIEDAQTVVKRLKKALAALDDLEGSDAGMDSRLLVQPGAAFDEFDIVRDPIRTAIGYAEGLVEKIKDLR